MSSGEREWDQVRESERAPVRDSVNELKWERVSSSERAQVRGESERAPVMGVNELKWGMDKNNQLRLGECVSVTVKRKGREFNNDWDGKWESSQCLFQDRCYSLCSTILLLSLFPLGNSTHSGAAFHLLEMGSDHYKLFYWDCGSPPSSLSRAVPIQKLMW